MAKECSRVLKHGCIQTCEAVQKHRKRFELNLLERGCIRTCETLIVL